MGPGQVHKWRFEGRTSAWPPIRRTCLASLAAAAAIGALVLAGLGFPIPRADGQSTPSIEFADWTSAEGNVATGTLLGATISLSGSHVGSPPVSRVDGTSTVFNQPYFSPPLPTSDAIELFGFQGYSYVLQFGSPTRDPVLHIASLASTLAFPAGTQVTKVSGQSTFTASANTVTGALDGSTDANGTVRLSGTFTSVSFSATPVYPPSTEDGFDVQVGAAPPPPASPPPTQSAPQPATPKTLADLPPPVIGQLANVEPVKGTVLVAVPAGAGVASGAGLAVTAQKGLRFVPLREAAQIPVRSFLDTRHGTVRLQSAAGRGGRRQAGDFVGGLFQILQTRRGAERGLTELRLKGSSFRSCRPVRGGNRATAARRLSRRVIRRLGGNAKGRFRTRGRYSAATVRGTVWASIDRCDGTLTTVRRGEVAVRDFRRRRTVVVRSGERYLARARG